MLLIILIVLALLLFGFGAVIEGALWLLAVGLIVLIAAAALGIGQFRKRV
jgi:hypothetical protein